MFFYTAFAIFYCFIRCLRLMFVAISRVLPVSSLSHSLTLIHTRSYPYHSPVTLRVFWSMCTAALWSCKLYTHYVDTRAIPDFVRGEVKRPTTGDGGLCRFPNISVFMCQFLTVLIQFSVCSVPRPFSPRYRITLSGLALFIWFDMHYLAVLRHPLLRCSIVYQELC